MSEKPTVYLAGPINDPRATGWRDYLREYFTGFDWVDPTAQLDPEEYDQKEAPDAVAHDQANLEEADAVLVGWTRVPSVNTAMEVQYCVDHGIPVVVLLEPEGTRNPNRDRQLDTWLAGQVDVHHSPAAAIKNIESYVAAEA